MQLIDYYKRKYNYIAYLTLCCLNEHGAKRHAMGSLGLWALSKGISGVGAPANSLLSREWRTSADWQTLHGGSRRRPVMLDSQVRIATHI